MENNHNSYPPSRWFFTFFNKLDFNDWELWELSQVASSGAPLGFFGKLWHTKRQVNSLEKLQSWKAVAGLDGSIFEALIKRHDKMSLYPGVQSIKHATQTHVSGGAGRCLARESKHSSAQLIITIIKYDFPLHICFCFSSGFYGFEKKNIRTRALWGRHGNYLDNYKLVNVVRREMNFVFVALSLDKEGSEEISRKFSGLQMIFHVVDYLKVV